ncbi:transcriptional regulator FimZ [Enterobacter asburiae]|uniref:Transcriptional regulator FimZ n=1 Tax=Enterobacter asburiae TaxID=61645 RepID=A0A376F538_ENTAS|nr:transcriptional regulator FimZ [Enterobacter asburiae]
MKPASVIIMDEHPIVRMSIEVLLQKNKNIAVKLGNDSKLLIVFYVQIMPDDFIMQLHRF